MNVRGQEADADQRSAATAKGALALDLVGKLPADGNLFFSPESISVALGMTALGARAKTLDAFEKVLHVPRALGWERFHAALGARVPEGEGFTLRSANRLFGQRGFPFRPEFEDSVGKRYAGGLEAIDFKDPSSARKTINAWVSKETREKIPELIAAPMPPPDSRLVLVNAVYFKARWDDPFDPERTKDDTFKVTASKSVPMKLMKKTQYCYYTIDDACQMATKGYQGGRFEAVFLLPKKDDVAALAKGLTFDKLEALRTSAKPTFTALEIPRFKFGWGKDVSTELKALGLAVAFSAEDSDFSGIADAPKEPLYIGSVIHKAIVALDEEGTEAAAATAVGMRAGGVPPKPISLRLDRPFLFLVRDKLTGSIVFLGRVTDPSAD